MIFLPHLASAAHPLHVRGLYEFRELLESETMSTASAWQLYYKCATYVHTSDLLKSELQMLLTIGLV
jgi:hypothetical protein